MVSTLYQSKLLKQLVTHEVRGEGELTREIGYLIPEFPRGSCCAANLKKVGLNFGITE